MNKKKLQFLNFLIAYLMLIVSINANTEVNYYVAEEIYIKKADLFDISNKEVFHLFSHGKPGELLIDGFWCNANELKNFLKQITNKFTHINIYGCNFAKGEKGKQAVSFLEKALGVSIAASDDITGIDGDWNLEVGVVNQTVHLPSYNGNLQCTDPDMYTDNCDFDGDGILNGDDLDDDNDGILDTDECGAITWNAINLTTLQANASTIASAGGQTFTDIGTTLGIPHLEGKDLTLQYTFDGTEDCTNAQPNYQFMANLTSSTSASNTLYQNFQFYVKDGTLTATLSTGDRYMSWFNIGTGYNGGEVSTFGPAGSGSIVSSHSGTHLSLTDDQISRTDADCIIPFINYGFGYWNSSQELNQITYTSNKGNGSTGMLRIGRLFCDLDGDGISNQFDTDSDGDGCADAIEGGSSFTSTDLTTDDNLCNTTTCVDTDGIPTNTGSPQSVGDSQDANTQSQECNPEPICADNPTATEICQAVTDNPTGVLAMADCDGDGMTNGEECNGTTDPTDPCDPGVALGSLEAGSAWADADCDGDGVANRDEVDPDRDGTPNESGEGATNPNDPCDYNASDISLPVTAVTDCDGDGEDSTTDPDDSDPCNYNASNQDYTATSQEWKDGDCDGDGVTNGTEIDPDDNGTNEGNGTDPSDECDFTESDITLPVTADQSGCNSDCPDLTPIVRIIPSVIQGRTEMHTVIVVSEINGLSTSGRISVRIPVDPRVTIAFDNMASMVGIDAVDNPDWTYSSSTLLHEFQTLSVINGNSDLKIGITLTYDPQNTDGETILSSTVSFGSGSECVFDNNYDDEVIRYNN